MNERIESKRRRWYRVTPERFLLAILFVDLGLFAIDSLTVGRHAPAFHWYDNFVWKGWMVMAALTLLAFAMLVLLVGCGVCVFLRRRVQFSLRFLCLLVAVFGFTFGWLGAASHDAKRQCRAIRWIEDGGGMVFEGCFLWTDPFGLRIEEWFGDSFFSEVDQIHAGKEICG